MSYSCGMCGRFTLHTPEAEIRQTLGIVSAPVGLAPRYNIVPSQEVAIVRATGAGPALTLARWGLVPHWSKEPQTRYSTINARLETVADKPAYRQPFRHRRCLLPADGFYEWKEIDGRRIPHHIRMDDGGVFAFAGLWDHWEGVAAAFDSCSIIVMPAHTTMRSLHERMPAIIAPADYAAWLDTTLTDRDDIMKLLDSGPSRRLTHYPVSTRVNSPKHDDAACMAAAQ